MLFFTVSFVFAGIEFGYFVCRGDLNGFKNSQKCYKISLRSIFANIFANFETTYSENQILYQRKQNAQLKLHTIAESIIPIFNGY